MRSEEALIALADERAEQGVPVTRMWKDAIDGFAAVLTPNEVTALQNNPDVLSVDPPQLITLSSTQITPPWGLDRIDQRNRPLSGSYTYASTGAGVDAYVLDTGIRGTHTEFTGRIPRGAYVDFGDGTGVADCNGHGTHVAGTLGGTSYGVAKGVDIIPVKVLDCDGWTMEELIISGLDWIISDHEAGQPAVLNMSLGGPASNTLDAAVNAAINDGITVVVAAGNETDWTCFYSPARVPGAITVAASEIDDDDADYSNYGQCNDIFAPGTGILSSSIGSDTATNTLSGTSMASPHVAGAAARVLQNDPSLTPAGVWNVIDANATVGVLSECCGDPDKLLYLEGGPVSLPPSAPLSVVAIRGNGQAVVQWSPPAVTSGLAVAAYRASSNPDGYECWAYLTETCTVAGLTNGTSYTFTVSAYNEVGQGPPSEPSNAIVPSGEPGQVPSVAGTGGFESMTLTWSAPPVLPGVAQATDYVIEHATSINGPWTRVTDAVSSETTTVIPGLVNNSFYFFHVAALNSAGQGEFSLRSSGLVPGTVPTEPLRVTVSADSWYVHVSWSPPVSDGGRPIAGYTATAYPGGNSCWVVNELHCKIGSVIPGTAYQVRVNAENGAGVGPQSPLTEPVTPLAPPHIPIITGATGGGSGTIVLYWDMTWDGGAPVLDYDIQYASQADYQTHTWTFVENGTSPEEATAITGLPVTTMHWFRVRATNSVGDGYWSNPFSDASAPSPPLNVAATPATAGLTVSWSVPQSTGTSPITDYTLEMSVDGGGWSPVTDGVSTNNAHNMPGLANGFTYSFRVRAVNANGSSDPSSVASVTLGNPSPPALTATPQNGKVQLTWAASPPSGAALVDYVIQRSKNGGPWTTVKDGTGTRTSFLVTSLTNGVRYSFRIAAKSTFATGGWSTFSGATPRTVPGKPRSLTVVSRNTSVTLSWRPPSDNGGAPITDYVVQYSLNGISWTTVADAVSTSTSLTVLGLTNGVRYRFRVVAANIAGVGKASSIRSASPHI